MHDIQFTPELLKALDRQLTMKVENDSIIFGVAEEPKPEPKPKSKPRTKKTAPKKPVAKKTMRLGVCVGESHHSEEVLQAVRSICKQVVKELGVAGTRAIVIGDPTGELALATSINDHSFTFHEKGETEYLPNKGLRPLAGKISDHLNSMPPQDVDVIVTAQNINPELLGAWSETHLTTGGRLICVSNHVEIKLLKKQLQAYGEGFRFKEHVWSGVPVVSYEKLDIKVPAMNEAKDAIATV